MDNLSNTSQNTKNSFLVIWIILSVILLVLISYIAFLLLSQNNSKNSTVSIAEKEEIVRSKNITTEPDVAQDTVEHKIYTLDELRPDESVSSSLVFHGGGLYTESLDYPKVKRLGDVSVENLLDLNLNSFAWSVYDAGEVYDEGVWVYQYDFKGIIPDQEILLQNNFLKVSLYERAQKTKVAIHDQEVDVFVVPAIEGSTGGFMFVWPFRDYVFVVWQDGDENNNFTDDPIKSPAGELVVNIIGKYKGQNLNVGEGAQKAYQVWIKDHQSFSQGLDWDNSSPEGVYKNINRELFTVTSKAEALRVVEKYYPQEYVEQFTQDLAQLSSNGFSTADLIESRIIPVLARYVFGGFLDSNIDIDSVITGSVTDRNDAVVCIQFTLEGGFSSGRENIPAGTIMYGNIGMQLSSEGKWINVDNNTLSLDKSDLEIDCNNL